MPYPAPVVVNKPYDNPLAIFASNLLGGVAQGAQMQQQEGQRQRQMQAYMNYMGELQDKKDALALQLANLRGQYAVKVQHAKPVAASADPNIQAQNAVKGALQRYANFIKNGTNNDTYKFMTPAEQQQYQSQLGKAFYSDPANASDVDLLNHASDINRKVLSSNPVLKSVFPANPPAPVGAPTSNRGLLSGIGMPSAPAPAPSASPMSMFSTQAPEAQDDGTTPDDEYSYQ